MKQKYLYLIYLCLYFFSKPFLCYSASDLFFNEVQKNVLIDNTPFSFVQNSRELKEEDILIETLPLNKLIISISPKSIQWVHTNGFDLPRAVLKITLPQPSPASPSISTAFLNTAETHVPLFPGENKALIPLFSHPDKPATLTLGHETIQIKITLKNNFLFLKDPSCHPYNLTLHKSPSTGLMSVSCELIFSKSDHRDQPILKLNVATEKSAESYLLNYKQNKIEINEQTILSAKIAKDFRPFQLSLGLGPYALKVSDSLSTQHALLLYPTIYASYFLRDSLRLVSFVAIAPHKMGHIDIGSYLLVQQFKGIADRVSIQLLLGLRGLIFRDSEQNVYEKLSAPQGIEISWKDFMIPTYNASLGAFLSPSSETKSYTNLWFRYGKRTFFGELNYIHWIETIKSTQTFKTSSLGLSVGLPLL